MNKTSGRRRVNAALIAGVILIFMILFTISRKTFLNTSGALAEYDSGYRQIMGTIARVVVVADRQKPARQAINAAFQQLELVDNMMSAYKTDSQISLVNREAYERPVKVDEPLFVVLKKSLYYSRITKGAFDITVGPLIVLYKQSLINMVVPTQQQLDDAKLKVGYEKLHLDENARTVKFDVQGMRLDLGAIAKGYAVDKAIDVLQNTGIKGAMVDLGGNIRCFGYAPRGNGYWKIGLQDPKDTSQPFGGNIVLKLKLNDISVATSGDYRRFTLIGDKKVSHILDPNTGSGAKELSSVTIITQTAVDADALSTSVTVLGTEKGIQLINSIPNTEAILIRSEQPENLIKTSGADKYIE